jgi:hypothetical protein
MEAKDRRLALIKDVLRGIKAVKLYVWETFFIRGIQNARLDEARSLRAVLWAKGWLHVLWDAAPTLVSAKGDSA